MNNVSHAYLNYLHQVNDISSHTIPERERFHGPVEVKLQLLISIIVYTLVSAAILCSQHTHTVLDNTWPDNQVLLETVLAKAVKSYSKYVTSST